MYKRFSVLFFLVLTLFSSGFSLLEFSPQNVTLTSYDENTGVGQLDFDITYNGSEEIYLTINTKGLLVDNFFAIENVMNGSSLKHISHNFDISQFGNYTQEYYISVTVDDLTSTAFPVTVIGEREIQSLKVNYLGGTEVPSLKKFSGTTVKDLFIVLGTLISAIVSLLVDNIFTLIIVFLLIGAVGTLITAFSKNIEKTLKKK